MPKFFINEIPNEHYCLTGPDARHISYSLRMRVGEKIILCDGKGTDYDAVIDEISKDSVYLSILSSKKNPCENENKIIIYQAMIKPDKFEEVIKKSVEYGASEIIPLITERCEYTFKGKDISSKLERWRKISEEAAKQCGRGIIPKIASPVSFKDIVADGSYFIFCYEKSILPMKNIMATASENNNISIVIGPEGGFTDNEVTEANNKKMNEVSLGKRILRSESVAPFVLAILSYEKDK